MKLLTGIVMALAVAVVPSGAAALEEQFALIVSGATGGEPYSEQQAKWRAALEAALREKLGVEAPRIANLSDDPAAQLKSTREEVRRQLASFAKLTQNDVLLVVLLGHGSADADEAKFNLVGPDLSAAEWRELLRPIRARVIFVNTTSASFPFLERLAAPRRVVITATDSVAQRFVTVFPEYFIQALSDPAADIDKNDRVSIWEAFSAASLNVRQHYEQRGQLTTERALLDDNGDGIGREAGTPGGDGTLASRIYLDASTEPEAATDPELVELLQRRVALEADVDELRARKPLMPAADYAAEFERLMIDLARVSREIRRRKS
jgi:LmbE family N-acetylglucosaminyl deacetylase